MQPLSSEPEDETVLGQTRRHFFGKGARGLGSLALFSLLADHEAKAAADKPAVGGLPGLPHFAPKAKRAIYLHMLGAPPNWKRSTTNQACNICLIPISLNPFAAGSALQRCQRVKPASQ